MDDAEVDLQQHWEALSALKRIHRCSNRDFFLWRELQQLAPPHGDPPLRVLDIATGGGDLPITLWHRAKQSNQAMYFDGCDRSEQALAYARRDAEESHAHVRFFPYDVFQGPLPAGYDVLLCSLFFHHMSEDEVMDFLRRAHQAAGKALLVYDLDRTYLSYWAVWLGTRLLARGSRMAKYDGLVSVQAAFTVAEVQKLARNAGMAGVVIRRVFPAGYLLSWRRA